MAVVHRTVIGSLLTAAFALGLASPATAQDPPPLTITGGLSFLHFSECEGCGTEVGIRGEVSKVLRPVGTGGFAIAGEVGWTKGEFSSTLTLAVAPRYVIPVGSATVHPYVHVFVGLARYGFEFFDSSTNLLIGPGGGVTFPLTNRLRAFGQVDFVIVRVEDELVGSITDNAQRFTVGVSFAIGK